MPAGAADYPVWNLQQRPPGVPDYLSYVLSYRGLFTGFAWKSLADVAIYASPETEAFAGREACALYLRLSTERHRVAELFHPVRYQWKSLVTPGPGRVLLYEETDEGKDGSHEVVWPRWDQGRIELFRKRRWQRQRSFYEDDAEEGAWESGEAGGLPDFLKGHEPLPGGLSYFIHRKTVEGIEARSALDPLGMIYAIRAADFSNRARMTFKVLFGDEVRPYQVRYLGNDPLEIDHREVNALVVEIMRQEKDKAREEGWLKLWLSADSRRLPLQFVIDAPVGKMRIKVTDASFRRYGGNGGICPFGG